MYRPPAFDVADRDELHRFLRAADTVHLVTAHDGPLMSTMLPMLFDADAGEHGSLVGHVARGNPHWRLGARATASMAIVAGPDAYVSPSWYATKQETGKVVPTWNYEVVHVHGDLVVHDDPAWVTDVVTRLTERHEARRAEPWSTADAPADYIASMVRAIVGVELRITAVEGKRKLSQNRGAVDVAGVIAGLDAGTDRDREVAAAMRAAAAPAG